MENISKKIKETNSTKNSIKSRNLIIIAFLVLLITSISLFSTRLVSAREPKTFSIIKEVNGGIGIKFTAGLINERIPQKMADVLGPYAYDYPVGDSFIVIKRELTKEEINEISDYSFANLLQEEYVKKSLRKQRTILRERKKGLKIIKELKIDKNGNLIEGIISYPPLEINEKESISDFIKSDKIGHIGDLIDDKKPEDIFVSNAEINFKTKELDINKNGFIIMREPGNEPHKFAFYEALNDGLKVIYNGAGSITLKENKIIGFNLVMMEYDASSEVGYIESQMRILAPLKEPFEILIERNHYATSGYFFYKPKDGRSIVVYARKGVMGIGKRVFNLFSGELSLSRNGKRERCMYAKNNGIYQNLKVACGQVAIGTTIENLGFHFLEPYPSFTSTKNVNILYFQFGNLEDIKKQIRV